MIDPAHVQRHGQLCMMTSKELGELAQVFESNYATSHADKWQALDEMVNVYSQMLPII